MSLIVLSGLLAADLSTVSRLLAQRFDRGVHVPSGQFRRMIVRSEIPEGVTAEQSAMTELRLRGRVACQVADEFCKAGFTVVLQEIIVGELLYEALASVVTRPRYVVELGPKPNWELDDTRPGLWLDDTGAAPEETVKRILDQLDEALID